MLLWLWIVVGFATLVCAVVGVAWGKPMLLWSCTWFWFHFSVVRQRPLNWICIEASPHWLLVHGISIVLSSGKSPCREIQGVQPGINSVGFSCLTD